mgnify:CR=1 FL=1
MQKPRVVLAYSGGLDTSIIVPWLKEHYGADVICVAADVGQGEELSGLEDKARASGASACYVEDLRDDFVTGFVWPTLRAGAIYGRKYLLGTSMARPIIAKAQVEVARKVGATHLAHGCTGKGNDQVRFELTYAALAPELPVIAPWREWDIRSREDALAYAAEHDVPVTATKAKIYSRDRNLWHVSHEGGPLEDPAYEPTEDLFLMTKAPWDAPAKPEYVTITFENGYPVAVDGEALSPVALLVCSQHISSRAEPRRRPHPPQLPPLPRRQRRRRRCRATWWLARREALEADSLFEMPGEAERAELAHNLALVAERAESLRRFLSRYSELARMPEPTLADADVAAILRQVAAVQPALKLADDLLSERLSALTAEDPGVRRDAGGDRIPRSSAGRSRHRSMAPSRRHVGPAPQASQPARRPRRQFPCFQRAHRSGCPAFRFSHCPSRMLHESPR